MEWKWHEEEWKGRGMKKNRIKVALRRMELKELEEEWKGRDMKKNGREVV